MKPDSATGVYKFSNTKNHYLHFDYILFGKVMIQRCRDIGKRCHGHKRVKLSEDSGGQVN